MTSEVKILYDTVFHTLINAYLLHFLAPKTTIKSHLTSQLDYINLVWTFHDHALHFYSSSCAHAAPRVWNSLPHTITDDLDISALVIKSRLRTFLYRRSYQYQ